MIDFERVFDGMVEAIESSSMGSMLAMLGGRKALLLNKYSYYFDLNEESPIPRSLTAKSLDDLRKKLINIESMTDILVI